MSKDLLRQIVKQQKEIEALKGANHWLHEIREVFMFEELCEWALGQDFEKLAIAIIRTKDVKGTPLCFYEATGIYGSKWYRRSAPTLEELRNIVMESNSKVADAPYMADGVGPNGELIDLKTTVKSSTGRGYSEQFDLYNSMNVDNDEDLL